MPFWFILSYVMSMFYWLLWIFEDAIRNESSDSKDFLDIVFLFAPFVAVISNMIYLLSISPQSDSAVDEFALHASAITIAVISFMHCVCVQTTRQPDILGLLPQGLQRFMLFCDGKRLRQGIAQFIEGRLNAQEQDTLSDALMNRQPSLPEVAKHMYIRGALMIRDIYYDEWIAPTNDKFIKARRKNVKALDIGEVEYMLFDGYCRLADAYGTPDDYPTFPLFGTSQKVKNVQRQLDIDFRRIQPLLDEQWLVSDFDVPLQNGEKRFEGTFVLAPAGSGKTTILQYLITHDMPYVERGEASIIVMDSQGDFLKGLLGLEQFQTTLKDRLIIIEPDVYNPIALNPFAIGRKRLNQHNAREREQMANATIELISHIFSTVGKEAKFTPRQALLFRHCVRLCLEIPNATLRTMHKIFTTHSVSDYEEYVEKLDEQSRHFFSYEFPTSEFRKVCTEVSWRLGSVLENTTLARMLCAPTSTIDLFEELNRGAFVIINTDRAMLGEERSSVFGRIMIALIRLAMRERDTTATRLPTYCYIDEVHEYLDNDTQVATMIDDVRKSRLALVMATQRLEKITDPNVRDALLSCGIVLARPNAQDAHSVAKYVETHHDNLSGLHDRTFWLYARGLRQSAQVQIPTFHIASLPHVEDWTELRNYVRHKYAYAPKAEEAPPIELVEEEIKPSDEL